MSVALNKIFEAFPFTRFRKPQLLTFDDEAAVVEKANKEGRILMMLQNDVYDVTNYLDKHPGGKEVLLMANGKIIDKVFAKYHYPLGKAPQVLKKYKIGYISPKTDDSDSSGGSL